MTIDEVAHIIIGVTPPEFFGLQVGRRVDLTVPIASYVMYFMNLATLRAHEGWVDLMSSSALYSYLLILLLPAVVSCATSRPGLETAAHSATAASSSPWLQYADVRQAGFDGQALRAVCERADSLHSGALMAVFRGHVILACGDVNRPLEAHSVRKSLVSGLYGTAVARGEINLDATLADFGIDERTPLTAEERSATIRQVISARSGVYLPAAYGASQDRRRPERGSHPPGTHWFYNNWDFNIAGVVYERATGEDLYESFERRLAQPLGMEDWNPADGFRVYEPTKSRYPAHTFRISTRDLARFGQLYLQEGSWERRLLLPADWLKESTRPHTDDGDGTGYGYMWWTYRAGSPFTAKYPTLGQHTFYRGLGTGEQGLWVIPDANLVVVHRADTDHGRTIAGEDHWRLVESILAARRSEPEPKPDLRPLQATTLSTQLPPVTMANYRALPQSVLDDYFGNYELAPGATDLGEYKLTPAGTVRVFLFDEKPYIHLPGVGDVQMFPSAQDTFTVRVVQGVGIAFERSADDEVTAVTLTVGDYMLRASRAQTR
jgi:CubicO group peptidase (beta-lactamase class C family)